MSFKLTILGSSSAIPIRDRLPTSQVLKVWNHYYLIDCGEGTQMQLRKYRIPMQRIHRIFISHLHGDHFFGLIGLLSTYSLMGRTKELHIYANPALESIITAQLTVSLTELRYPLVYHPLEEEVDHIVFEDEDICVTAIPVVHSVPTYGFLFREKPRPPKILTEQLSKIDVPPDAWKKIRAGEDFVDGQGKRYPNEDLLIASPRPRSYAFISDTRYEPEIVGKIAGVDLLYHEATFADDMKEVAYEKFHSTASQAAQIAQAANVGKLIIGHFSARYKELDGLVNEARSIFPDTETAEEGDRFEVQLKN